MFASINAFFLSFSSHFGHIGLKLHGRRCGKLTPVKNYGKRIGMKFGYFPKKYSNVIFDHPGPHPLEQ